MASKLLHVHDHKLKKSGSSWSRCNWGPAARANAIGEQKLKQMQLGSRSWSKCNLHVQTLGELLAKAQHLIPRLLSVH